MNKKLGILAYAMAITSNWDNTDYMYDGIRHNPTLKQPYWKEIQSDDARSNALAKAEAKRKRKIKAKEQL